jgi:mannitol-specific phosphotransferase system IIBC component
MYISVTKLAILALSSDASVIVIKAKLKKKIVTQCCHSIIYKYLKLTEPVYSLLLFNWVEI